MDDIAKHKKSAEDQIRAYKKYQELDNDHFAVFAEMVIKTVADKMVWSFVGDNIKSWDDFCKVRGEIVAYLYPIQEVKGAKAMAQHLSQQLKEFYQVD